MIYSIECLFQVNKYCSSDSTFVHINIPVICRIQQTSDSGVQGPKPRLLFLSSVKEAEGTLLR